MTLNKETPKLYLVTDPCYLFENHDDWMKALDTYGYDGGWENVKCDIGVILESTNTANGDGSVKVSNNKEITVDAGLVCIVEITDFEAHRPLQHGDAITRTLDVAKKWYEKAAQI